MSSRGHRVVPPKPPCSSGSGRSCQTTHTGNSTPACRLAPRLLDDSPRRGTPTMRTLLRRISRRRRTSAESSGPIQIVVTPSSGNGTAMETALKLRDALAKRRPGDEPRGLRGSRVPAPVGADRQPPVRGHRLRRRRRHAEHDRAGGHAPLGAVPAGVVRLRKPVRARVQPSFHRGRHPRPLGARSGHPLGRRHVQRRAVPLSGELRPDRGRPGGSRGGRRRAARPVAALARLLSSGAEPCAPDAPGPAARHGRRPRGGGRRSPGHRRRT